MRELPEDFFASGRLRDYVAFEIESRTVKLSGLLLGFIWAGNNSRMAGVCIYLSDTDGFLARLDIVSCGDGCNK